MTHSATTRCRVVPAGASLRDDDDDGRQLAGQREDRDDDMAARQPEVEPKRKNPRRLPVLLYAPNIVGYVRILLAMAAFFAMESKSKRTIATPLVVATLYLLCFALDFVDGWLARTLNQVSEFGAFLDVAIDCGCRAAMWAAAIQGPGAVLIPAVEWIVFVATHAQGGAAWKTGCFTGAPRWVSEAMKSNFRSPIGVLVMGGLHFLPLWLWLRSSSPGSVLASPWLGAALGAGRLYCLCVEAWVLRRYISSLLAADNPPMPLARAKDSV